ncbi:hypothetical protein [Chroococcidiopsis sp.]|uniref:hypothetical protein n=1 Tax=Chroococcidiopsis sp. TaxID=3088168 RepID=UPI003F369926
MRQTDQAEVVTSHWQSTNELTESVVMKFIQRIVIFAQVTQATSDTESKTLSLDRGVTKSSV